MKKVLFTATVDSHISAFHLPFLKLFKEKGYEVHVATNGDKLFPNCDKKHQICIQRSPYKLANIKAIRQLKKIIEEERFDIIHCHTPMGAVVTRLAARKARKKYGTRVIYTAHGFHFFKGAPKLNWIMFYPIEKWLAKYTDTLITINEEDYQRAKNKFSKRCHDIQYVPGVGIDPQKFNLRLTKKQKTEIRKSLGLKDDDFVMIFVARLDKNKNQGFLINVTEELLKEHDNIHLLLVGPDELNGYYQNMVKEKNLEKNVHFLGFRKDIPELMNISDIAVSASLREGLPVNIMEALISKLPIVATNARGVKDLIQNGRNGFIIDNNSMIEFCQKILIIKNNSSVLKHEKKDNNDIYLLPSILNKMNRIYMQHKE